MEKFDNDRFFFKNINRSDTGASVMGWGEKSLARLSKKYKSTNLLAEMRPGHQERAQRKK